MYGSKKFVVVASISTFFLLIYKFRDIHELRGSERAIAQLFRNEKRATGLRIEY